MIAPGSTLDRPRMTAPTTPPVMPPDSVLALVRSLDVGTWFAGIHAVMIVLRAAQNVVPKANVWSPDADAKRKGDVPLMMPDAPPTRKPVAPA